MKIKDVYKLEKQSEEVWVVSPDLYYDCKDSQFKQIVKANLASNTKYRYIVPNTEELRAGLERFQKYNKIDQAEIDNMFLLLPASEFGPFINELAIYNPRKKDRVSCLSPRRDCKENDTVVSFDKRLSKHNADHFKSVWSRYKRQEP